MTELRKKRDERTSTSSSSTSTSTSTTTYTPAPGVSGLLDLETIRDAYTVNIGAMSVSVASMIERFLRIGMRPDVICHAIEETGFAPRPTPHYLRAILTRYAKSGILTMDDVMRDENRRIGEQNQANNMRYQGWYGGDELPW